MSSSRRGAGLVRSKGNQSQRWTQRQVRRLLQELDKSGEPVAAFARRQGFQPQRLHWWMSKLEWKRTQPLVSVRSDAPESTPVSSAAPKFLPVRVVPGRPGEPVAPRSREAGVVVQLGHRQIRVEADFDAAVLRRVVQLLEEVSSC